MIRFKIKGYEYNGEIEKRNMFGNPEKYLVKRFLISGGYDYQLINEWNIIS